MIRKYFFLFFLFAFFATCKSPSSTKTTEIKPQASIEVNVKNTPIEWWYGLDGTWNSMNTFDKLIITVTGQDNNGYSINKTLTFEWTWDSNSVSLAK